MSGIVCPECGGETGIINSRAALENTCGRRRKCKTCGLRFTTREVICDGMFQHRPVLALNRVSIDKLADTLTKLLEQLKAEE